MNKAFLPLVLIGLLVSIYVFGGGLYTVSKRNRRLLHSLVDRSENP